MAEESSEIMPLTSVIARLPRVPESQKESMFLLYNRYFSNVSLTSFLHDMNEKDWVIQLRNGPNIVGFSTLQVLRLPVGGAERIFLFSGDTIVDQAHWQSSALAGSFGHFMLRLMADYELHRLYWFLISKGYRTYRFLPVYFRSFYPAYDRVTPPDYGALLHGVASRKFGMLTMRNTVSSARPGRRSTSNPNSVKFRNPAGKTLTSGSFWRRIPPTAWVTNSPALPISPGRT